MITTPLDFEPVLPMTECDDNASERELSLGTSSIERAEEGSDPLVTAMEAVERVRSVPEILLHVL